MESGSWPADDIEQPKSTTPDHSNDTNTEKPKHFSEMMEKTGGLSQMKDLNQTIGHREQGFWYRLRSIFCPCWDKYFTTETYIHYY